MRLCRLCNDRIPAAIKIDGKKRILANRTKCLKCLPFKQSPYVSCSLEDKDRIRKLKNNASQRQYGERFKQENSGKWPASLRRETKRLNLIKEHGGKCVICKYDRCVHNLCFHHLDPKSKEFKLDARSMVYKYERLKREAEKCILVCHLCHGEIHHGIIQVITVNI